MSAEPERSVEEQIEAITSGDVSDADLPALVTEIQNAIEKQRRREQEIERFADERRRFIRENHIESVFENTSDPLD